MKDVRIVKRVKAAPAEGQEELRQQHAQLPLHLCVAHLML